MGATLAIPTIGALRERVRLETPSAGAWAIDSVVSAQVVTQPPSTRTFAFDAAQVPVAKGEILMVTVRYRADFALVGRSLRIRHGSDSLIVLAVNGDLTDDRQWSRFYCERWLAYAARHDAMVARVLQQGTAITFTKPQTGATYDPGTDTVGSPASMLTIAGWALEEGVETSGYAPASLEQQSTRTLLFAPAVYGDLPEPGMVGSWGGVSYSIEKAAPVAPDGVVIASTLTVSA